MRRYAAIAFENPTDDRTLASVAEASLAFGITTAYSTSERAVFVDVTGCEHLHATKGDPTGASTLAARLAECMANLGHDVRIAFAKGPRIALAFARHGRGKSPILATDDAAFAKLPVSALPIDEKSADFLRKMSFRKIGDLRKVDPSSLVPRLGAGGADAMTLLRGEDGAPLTPYVPPEIPEEAVELEYGIESAEPLLFVAKRLCDRLSARLEARTRSVTDLELCLSLDRAMAKRRTKVKLPLRLAAPIRKAEELMAVLRVKVESYTFEAPVLAVTLRATALVAYELRPRELFHPESRAELALPKLLTELTAELGEDKVGVFALGDRWLMDQRSLLVSASASGSSAPRAKPLVTRALEPLHFFKNSVPLPKIATGKKKLLARTEALEWWRTASASVDHFAVFLPELGALAWVMRHRDTGQQAILGFIEASLPP